MSKDEGALRVLSGDKLAQVLELACEEKSRIKVSPGVRSFAYYSAILELHTTQVYLGRLEPSVGEEELLVGSEIEIVFPLTSPVYFAGKSRYEGVKFVLNEPMYNMIARPEALMFSKQRRTERVEPTESFPAVALSIGNRALGPGEVRVKDISAEGALLSFAEAFQVSVESRLLGIKLKLGTVPIALDGRVRHHKYDEDGRFCVGLMWEPMSRPQFTAVANYINNVKKYSKKSES
jgi:hypothetical protein